MVCMFFDIFYILYQVTSNTIEANRIELNGTYLSLHTTCIYISYSSFNVLVLSQYNSTTFKCLVI